MKSKTRPISALTSVLLLILVSIGLVYAPWSTLGTGYAITSNYHGVNVPLFLDVTVTAGTLDSSVVQVTFRWHKPPDGNGPVEWEDVVPVFTNGTMGQWNNGTWAEIRYAKSTHAPNAAGDWGVQAFFQDSSGTEKSGVPNVVKIKATSFNSIPEIPLGTIGAAAAMIFAFAFFMTKKRGRVAVPPLP